MENNEWMGLGNEARKEKIEDFKKNLQEAENFLTEVKEDSNNPLVIKLERLIEDQKGVIEELEKTA